MRRRDQRLSFLVGQSVWRDGAPPQRAPRRRLLVLALTLIAAGAIGAFVYLGAMR